MKSRLLLFIFSILLVSWGCKKSSNKIQTSPSDTVTTDTDLTDSLMSTDDANFLESLPIQHYTLKELILDNGETVYNYLSKNDPTILNLKLNHVKTNGTATNLTPEEERTDIFAHMSLIAEKLTETPYNSQPNGLAWVNGSKDLNSPRISKGYTDKYKKFHPAKCQDVLYGLDCSGYLYQMTVGAKIKFKFGIGDAGTGNLSNPDKWNDAFDLMGYSALRMKKYDTDILGISDLKIGDIIYWVKNGTNTAEHIGVILKNSDGDLVVFASDGQSQYTCSQNSSETSGPVQIDLKDIAMFKEKWGILRITVPTIVYSGVSSLPGGARYGLAGAAAKNIIMFAGGSTDGGVTDFNVVDVYDTLAKKWSTTTLSGGPRYQLAAAAAGSKIYFAGGTTPNGGYSDIVDIFDVSTTPITHTTKTLSQARGILAGAGSGNFVMFAGGDSANGYTNTVDIFDVTTGERITTTLQEGRRKLAGAATGNVFMFAGGEGGASDSGFGSNLVDIFTISDGKITPSTNRLSVGTYALAGAGNRTKIVFAGGGNSNTAEIFDIATGKHTTLPVPESKQYNAAAAAGTKIVFAGGGDLSSVFIYDINTNTFSTLPFSDLRDNLAGAATGDKIFFAGGDSNPNGSSRTVDMYTIVSK